MAGTKRTYPCDICGTNPVSVRGQVCWHCLDELEAALFAPFGEEDIEEPEEADEWMRPFLAELEAEESRR